MKNVLLWLVLALPLPASADVAPPGPQDLCGCSVLGVLPVPACALLLGVVAIRRPDPD